VRIKLSARLRKDLQKAENRNLGYILKPAKLKPALLQAIAVIIMCEPSRE